MSLKSTAVVVLGIFLLLITLSLFNLPMGSPANNERELFAPLNSIRNISVVYQGKPYTLNFSQQIRLAGILNECRPVLNHISPLPELEPPVIEKILIHGFNVNDIEITPLGYLNSNLIIQTPVWSHGEPLEENSYGELRHVLNDCHD